MNINRHLSGRKSKHNNGSKPNFSQAKDLKPNFDFEKYNIGIKDIADEVKKKIQELNKPYENVGLFLVKSANQWIDEAKSRPIPKMLFGELWYESEIGILFADTNAGKSILAVQIGNSIAKGNSIHGFKLEAERQKVLYFDFELSDKQFEIRYSENFESHYCFDEGFIRIEIDSDSEMPEKQTFEEYLNFSLEQCIVKTGAKILIIDNLTYLRNETEKAKDASPLMKHLRNLKKKHGLSLLILAHTPKRDLCRAITQNNLQGSKMLMNFCDSAFTIGESCNDKTVRYIKQIKQRNTVQNYGSDNVFVCQIVKPYNFVQFEFMGFSSEGEHLKQFSEKDKESQIEQVKELNRQGKSLREIGNILNISHMKANRILKDCNKV